MKQLSIITAMMIGGILAWLVASELSADALGMAVGLLFGILAGVPTALLVLASGRRRHALDEEDERCDRYQNQQMSGPYPYQPPVIVLAAPAAAPQPPVANQGSYYYREVGPGQYVKVYTEQPAPPATERKFKVVGEKEEYLGEW